MAFANMLGGRDPMDMTDDEIRASLNEYYTRYVLPTRLCTALGSGRNLKGFSFLTFISLFRWDLPPKDPRRVYPLRIPDAVLAGSLYSIHIRTYLHYFNNGELRISKSF